VLLSYTEFDLLISLYTRLSVSECPAVLGGWNTAPGDIYGSQHVPKTVKLSIKHLI